MSSLLPSHLSCLLSCLPSYHPISYVFPPAIPSLMSPSCHPMSHDFPPAIPSLMPSLLPSHLSCLPSCHPISHVFPPAIPSLCRYKYDFFSEKCSLDPGLLKPASKLTWNISSQTAQDIENAKKSIDR